MEVSLHGQIQKIAVALSLVATPFLVWLAVHAQTNTDDVNNWIDRTSQQFAKYEKYIANFGSDDEIIISWDHCVITDPRVEQAGQALREECAPYVARIVTGSDAVLKLRNSASRLSDQSARKRLRGSLVGEDLETTCVVARLSNHARSDLPLALACIEATLVDTVGIDEKSLHFGGKAITDHALNALTNQSLWWGIPGAILAACLSLFCVKNFRLTAGMIYVAGLAALTSLAMVPLSGFRVNGLLVLMPVLVFVLTLGCAVHMVRALQRHLRGPQDPHSSEPIQQSLKESRPPVILSMSTTAIGIGSLALSPLSSVLQFGIFSSLSLLLAMLMLTILLPALWRQFGTGVRHTTEDFAAARQLAGSLIKINRRPRTVLLGILCFSLPVFFGLTKFETDFEISNLFAARTDYAQDRAWIESHLYPLGRVDFTIRFPREKQLNRYQQLRNVQKIQASFREYKDYHRALSAANFVKIPRSSTRLQKQLTEQLVGNQLEHDYQKLNDEGMLFSDKQWDQWRITVACKINPEHDEWDHAQAVRSLGLAALPDDNPQAVQIEATGMGPLVAIGQRQLFLDLTRGLTTAIFLITPLIIISLGSLRLGLLGMVANLFPIAFVFGCYGLLGRRLDSGSILTASVGLGIAIDDTVHFLHYFKISRRLAKRDGHSSMQVRQSAVDSAITRCAWSIATTSIIICCGLCFFVLSDFLPVRNFSVVLISMMLAAALADLILLPALITGLPFGTGKKIGGREIPTESNAADS